MIRESHGKITERIYGLGSSSLPGYLITGETPVLFDCGVTYMGPAYLRDLKRVLGSPDRLAYLVITHSHFDHAGAGPFLKKKIPGLKVVASRLAAEIWQRPKAIRFIQDLSRPGEEKFKNLTGDADVTFVGLETDICVEDGAELDFGTGYRIQVIGTPGHTRDAVSYYIPELKTLIPGEAVGTLTLEMENKPSFLSSFQEYMQSLEKLVNLDLELVLMAHSHVMTGEDARGLVAQAVAKAKEFQKKILAYLQEAGGDQEAVVRRIYDEEYKHSSQEVKPFLINLQAGVKAVAEGK